MNFVGLEEQGFYKPFEAIGSAVRYNQLRADQKEREKLERARQNRYDVMQEEQNRRAIESHNAQMAESKLSFSEKERGAKQGAARQGVAGALPDLGVPSGRWHLQPPDRQASIVAAVKANHPDFPINELPQAWNTWAESVLPPEVPEGMVLSGEKIDEKGNRSKEFKAKPAPVTAQAVPGPGGEGFVNIGGEVKQRPAVTKPETGKPVSDETNRRIDTLKLLESQLPDLEKLISTSGDAGGPFESKLAAPFEWLSGPTKAHRGFDQAKSAMLAPLARGVFGEVGALSRPDQELYEKNLPLYSDTAEARRDKLEKLKTIIASSKAGTLSTLEGTGRDVSGIAPQLGAPGIVKPLPPGVTAETLIAEALEKIKQGAPAEAVAARLAEFGLSL